jgi:hypothetical protein
MSIARKILMGSSGGKKSTYVDDVFSTYLYKGTQGSNTANTGLDMTEGGLVWYKNRSSSNTQHLLTDTVRGANKVLYSDASNGENNDTGLNQTFTNTGWTLNNGYSDANNGSNTYTSWNFRKRKGFFDVVTWTGNGSTRTIPHNLGSLPGCIMVKNTSSTIDWTVWHRGSVESNATNTLCLNNTGGPSTNNTYFDNGSTPPTATNFTVHTSNRVNANGDNYVAYIFAGGASSAATARSVTFNQNYIKSGSTSDYTMGTGDFTVECWWKPNEISNQGICQISDGGNGLTTSNWENTIAIGHNGGNWVTYGGNGNADSADYPATVGTWYHLAYVKTGGSHKLYVNGIPVITRTDSTNYYGTTVAIGGYYSTGYTNRGEISNFRITKGQALYTTSFKPPIEPLTTTSQGATSSNVKLLCCNDASVTGSTVTGATISVGSGSPAASTESPFDDLEGFQFGEDGDQNLIKCGYYKTASNEDGDVYLGWEPQWLLVKRIDSSDNWMIVDSMRGFPNAQDIKANVGGKCIVLEANTTDADDNTTRLGITPTGFYADQYGANRTYVYMAIRRPDGLVGKPVEAGTDVFDVDFGNGSSTGPAFDANFAVDALIKRAYASDSDCGIHFRLTPAKDLRTNTNDVEGNDVNAAKFDYMNGVSINQSTSIWGLMWKRHAGLDVVTYEGTSNSTTKTVNHSLGRVPEMIWIKARNDAQNWLVYHKGLNGGTTPWNYHIILNDATTEGAYSFINQPNTIDFAVTSGWQANNKNYMAMLFASVDGISKVGYYDGTGSDQTINLGFTPRFLLFRQTNTTRDWCAFDTLRGITSGNDPLITLNNNNAQWAGGDYLTPATNGIVVKGNQVAVNASGGKYIYYAHA